MPVYSDTIGIYIGDSSCMVSFIRNDTVELLTNFDSSILFPIMVTTSSDGCRCCNSYTSRLYPDKTITNIFRIIGKSIYDEDVQKEISTCCLRIEENEDGNIGYVINGCNPEFWTPEMVLVEIMKNLQDLIKRNTDMTTKNCVLSISEMLSPKQRECVQQAVEKSGLHVIHVIEEAISVGYYFKREFEYNEDCEKWKNDTFLTFNLGDKNLSISIFNYIDDKPTLITTYTNSSINGDLIIQTIIKYMEEKINEQYGVDLLNGMNDSLIWQREYSRLYHDILIQLFGLNQVDSIDVELPNTCKRHILRKSKQKQHDDDESTESFEMNRSDLNSILRVICNQSISSIHACLASCHLQLEDIHHIIPISQFSDVPIIRNKLIQVFGEERVYRRISGISCVAFGLGEYILDFLLVVSSTNITLTTKNNYSSSSSSSPSTS